MNDGRGYQNGHEISAIGQEKSMLEKLDIAPQAPKIFI